jgi:hypothetical protein
LIAYDTDFYIKESEKEKYIKTLRQSTIDTEKAVRLTGKATVRLYWATLGIALVALVVGLVPYFNDKEKNELREKLKVQNTLLQLVQQQLLRQNNQPVLKDSLNKK